MPNQNHNLRESLISDIGGALRFDKGLARSAAAALADASEIEISDLLSAARSARQKLEQQAEALESTRAKLLQDIKAWNRENHFYGLQDMLNMFKALRSEQGSALRTIEILRKEHGALRRETLESTALIGLYFRTADAVARMASRVIGKRTDFDEKIELTELVIEALIGINDITIKHDARPFESTLYNCLRACIHLDSLGGFDQNVDRFSSAVINELKRIGPKLLPFVKSEHFSRVARNGEASIETMDRLLNAADVLKFWGIASSGKSNNPDDIFGTSFGLYDQALHMCLDYKDRAPLVISRYADAHLRLARLKFEEGGVTQREKILSHAKLGTELLSRIIGPNKDLSTDVVNPIPLKLKELQFAMLVLEVDPSIEELKSYTISTIFGLAESAGNKLYTPQPWIFAYKLLSEKYDDTEQSISILTEFIHRTTSALAQARALWVIARLKGDDYPMPGLPREPGWLDGMRRSPDSIFSFKHGLKGYDSDGFGPVGSKAPLILDGSFPNVGYAKLFRSLVLFDHIIRRLPSDQVIEEHIIERSGLLSYFAGSFGKEQIAGLEELSKFLLYRGKSRLHNRDVFASIRLLLVGTAHSDDAYWYGRLVDAYLHLHDLQAAQSTVLEARRKFPNDSYIAVQQSLLEVRRGKYLEAAGAISTFATEIGRDISSCHPAVQGIYAYSMMRADKAHVAEGIYRQMVSTRPGDWRASHGLGCLLYRRGPEYYLEALRTWTSTILLRDKVDDVFGDWVARDCILNISQTVKELNISKADERNHLAIFLQEIGEILPTSKLTGVLNGLAICGGLQSQILLLADHVSRRRDDRLSKEFIQCCMSMLVEDTIKQLDTSYATNVVEFALKHGAIGDLFGGAKGSYVRNFLRISANPIAESKFDARWKLVERAELSREWVAVAKVVSRSGYSPDYYHETYEALRFTLSREQAEVEQMLQHVIYRVAVALRKEANAEKILFGESYPRSFSVDREDTISEDLKRQIYNCDPDKLRALLLKFQIQARRSSDDTTCWEFSGEIDDRLRHSLVTANIRTELTAEDAFIASVDSSALGHLRLYN